jgi:hypothetical protein
LPNSSTAHSSHGTTDATEISTTNSFTSGTTPTNTHSTTKHSPETSSNETSTATIDGLTSTTLSEILTSTVVLNNSRTDIDATSATSEPRTTIQPGTTTISTTNSREESSTISTSTRNLETSGTYLINFKRIPQRTLLFNVGKFSSYFHTNSSNKSSNNEDNFHKIIRWITNGHLHIHYCPNNHQFDNNKCC